ncbi:HEAT repeat domain-containing protein [Actinoplanes couchii]|uniref:Sulfatase n=1 Tax=Actinoplanes couchii TaxID=403638 RepID=A0ABQ3XKR2_9ACTN|nr:HEAT repeat domain-containing protein [Actinoplanes couchii]MDR6319578.1 hypothetical protein [Actinoplanes couchii]GID59032.1 hypothetical protein Aco03nite_074360 [Actinoplanes couchii]
MGQHQAYAWQQKGYQEWEQAHLDGTLNTVQDRFWRPKPAEELYDLHADPDEVVNLATDPAHRATLDRLRAALDQHLLDVVDNGFIPEGSPLEGYDASRAPGAYPLARVLDLAGAAILRDPARIPAFTAGLADPNEVIRYWAATGLLILADRATPAAETLAARFAVEASPQVKVVIAESLTLLGRTSPAVSWLTDTLGNHADRRVRLQALNALTHVGAAAKPAMSALLWAATFGPDEYLRNGSRHLWHVLNGSYVPANSVFLP